LSVIVVILIGFLSGVRLSYNLLFWLAVILNSFLFASLAIGLAMVVKSHADQSLLTNFVITPMAFLGGTFFPLDKMPPWVQSILKLLPLTPASEAIRASAYGQTPPGYAYLILAVLGGAMFVLAINLLKKARD
jgi:ABC-type multidrug transport system permease subunit